MLVRCIIIVNLDMWNVLVLKTLLHFLETNLTHKAKVVIVQVKAAHPQIVEG